MNRHFEVNRPGQIAIRAGSSLWLAVAAPLPVRHGPARPGHDEQALCQKARP
jgi:hypothetical protein